MGSTSGFEDEKPVHRVRVSDFYMSKYEVTQGLYKAVTGSNPSYFNGDDNRPVEEVSWYDAVIFCNKLSDLDGFSPAYRIHGKDVSLNVGADGYRLPTEAEWEYAARGGNKSRGYEYSGSNNVRRVAWYHDNSGSKKLATFSLYFYNADSKTHAVGDKVSNELGLYDMSGNVWEWCWDWYGVYSSSSRRNPQGPASGSRRVMRGGSWYDFAPYSRSVSRYNSSPDARDNGVGFRLLLPIAVVQ